MHVTLAEPHVERAARHFAQVVAEIQVGKEQHGNIGRQCIDHGDRIP